MAGPWSAAQRTGELGHLIAHCQDAGHHHHADNALHMDDDEDSAQHVHAGSSASDIGLLTLPHMATAIGRFRFSPDLSQSSWLSPTLAGPLRPPMQRA